MPYSIQQRRQREVNTDPQRRCYNGVHYSSEWQWTPWEEVQGAVPDGEVMSRLKFWRELNDSAIEARGENARKEFRAVAEAPTQNKRTEECSI